MALHIGLGALWMMRSEVPAVRVSEMAVSIEMTQAAAVTPQVLTPPATPMQAKPKVRQVSQPPVQTVLHEVAASTDPVAIPPATAVAVAAPASQVVAAVVDSGPDFKAAYLNNPRPAYPMAARRMGWEGRVILNVEVLAEGRCGGINVIRSSGHEILDNAAVSTVKGWHFVPARHAGQPITQWFKLPINFSFEDTDA
ncbi:MAG: energy transducer TonB [Gallionella sp.]|nr:energy transducer TonB [Gallionella sp.]MDD4946475.1 energy transducer TonB [Gallionella sp.]MDD5612930.1 energy transducer TonB [Gallionella sp.]